MIIKNMLGMALATSLTIFFVVIFAPLLSAIEGYALPVTDKLNITSVVEDKAGIIVEGSFDKLRNCEFVSLEWRTSFGQRIDYSFLEDYDPISRPTGDQIIGPWLLFKVESLNNLEAIVTHQCHPLWQTKTKLYP